MISMRFRTRQLSPHIMNPMTTETLEELRTRVRKPIRLDVPHQEIARGKLKTNGHGEIGIPAENLFSCLVQAGRKVKNGKFNISTTKDTTLPALLSIRETFIPFRLNGTTLTEDNGWIVDARRGILKERGGQETAVCIIRPKFPQWELEFTLDVDEREVKPETIRDLVKVAGSKVGLGDYRPGRKGLYGRFEIAELEILNGDQQESEAASGEEEGGTDKKMDRRKARAAAGAIIAGIVLFFHNLFGGTA